MQFGKRIGPLARRVAAMKIQIPVYAGNASFFLLLSVFPVVSLLLSLLPYTPLTLDRPCSRSARSLHRTGRCGRWNFSCARSTPRAPRRSYRPAPC